MNQSTLHRHDNTKRELPVFYYHSHFLEMLDFVDAYYEHVLSESQRDFKREFLALGFPAQCLFVRMVNRKGSLFARARLRYTEIPNIERALDELQAAGFLRLPRVEHVDQILHFMTRKQLLDALRRDEPILSTNDRKLGGVKSTMKKSDVKRLLLEQLPKEELFKLLPKDGVVVQGRAQEIGFLLFLFFGRVQDGLSQFTMRDLGLVRTNEAGDCYEARFSDRDEAVQAHFFSTRLHDLESGIGEAECLAGEIGSWPSPQSTVAADLRDRLAYRLGRALEHDPPTALPVYKAGESVKCSERVVRLLLATGQKEEARDFLERCIEQPASDEEALMASDIYARKFGKKRTSALTDCLRTARSISVDEAYRGAPERAAVDWFRSQGYQAFRVENSLWRTLFGLLFWDLLFEGNASGVHPPFEYLPSTLSERRFAEEHASSIQHRLKLLDDKKALTAQLLRVSAARFGTPNGLFRWRQSILDALFALLEVAPAAGLRQMMSLLCEDYLSARHGYPDLLVIDDSGPRFVEIKTDGDQLRRNQLLRLEQLKRAGFRAEVVLVHWVLSAEQPYVVVDVETTGGRGAQHRVTEIGAVKVLNGKIVDRFQTLLNPQRRIPSNITRLTGISPEMIADAPIFADVADEFAAFLDGAIFVAHNVEFDYRFIGQEFRRLGRFFRMPKLCTCASMRKLYPGHKSYSLANLTSAYDIPLKTHHRALCDAEAAAHLLLMVNEKRSEQLLFSEA
ncbi:MAG: exonuclease domain-containing protein [Pseudomonadota bacterium]